MRKIFVITLCTFISIAILGGCQSRNSDTEQLQQFVENINSRTEKKLSNGMVLNMCEYKQGDSLFVYHIKVNDNRFNKVSADSIKSTLSRDLASPEMCKLTDVLVRNSIGLQYIYDSEKEVITIVFTPSELKQKK